MDVLTLNITHFSYTLVLKSFSTAVENEASMDPPSIVSLDVHAYDGHLQIPTTFIQPMLDRVRGMTDDDRRTLLVQFIARVQAHATATSYTDDYQTAMRAIAERGVDRNGNFDSVNGLHADELLCVHALRHTDDSLGCLLLAFTDMLTGMCPQGRCARLLQVYYMCFSE